MRCQLPHGPAFWAFLFTVDKDLAQKSQVKICPCGGGLHQANYPRKPRGSAEDLSKDCYRFSFCCGKDGCRKRVTPPSVRFLGRKVYLGAVVVLVSAMRQGPSPRRVRELSQLFDIDRRTIARWQIFWREHVPQTPFWKVARGRLQSMDESILLPSSLMKVFLLSDDSGPPSDDPHQAWKHLLLFLAPISTTESSPAEVA